MNGRRVLVDTGAWLAAFHRRDQYHDVAVRALRRLRAESVRLVVTNLIVCELHVHLVYGLGPVMAASHVRTIIDDPSVEQVFCDAALQAAAFEEWIDRFSDQPFSLTDAVSFAVMRSTGISEAFAFDRHFRIAGFETVGSGGQ
jgi:uncharacterized protein